MERGRRRRRPAETDHALGGGGAGSCMEAARRGRHHAAPEPSALAEVEQLGQEQPHPGRAHAGRAAPHRGGHAAGPARARSWTSSSRTSPPSAACWASTRARSWWPRWCATARRAARRRRSSSPRPSPQGAQGQGLHPHHRRPAGVRRLALRAQPGHPLRHLRAALAQGQRDRDHLRGRGPAHRQVHLRRPRPALRAGQLRRGGHRAPAPHRPHPGGAGHARQAGALPLAGRGGADPEVRRPPRPWRWRSTTSPSPSPTSWASPPCRRCWSRARWAWPSTSCSPS